MAAEFTLYGYFRSSASYRVRAALNFKDIPYEHKTVHLVRDGGEQFSSEYQKLNAMAQVPSLVHKGTAIGQSVAIIQYLDDVKPQPRLFPADPVQKALVLQFCEIINSGMQPLQNLQVLSELEKRFQASQEAKESWIGHWMKKGFDALESFVSNHSGQFCFGDNITAADCFLAPQVFASARFKYDVSTHKRIVQIARNLDQHPAFIKAHPKNQPDFQA